MRALLATLLLQACALDTVGELPHTMTDVDGTKYVWVCLEDDNGDPWCALYELIET